MIDYNVFSLIPTIYTLFCFHVMNFEKLCPSPTSALPLNFALLIASLSTIVALISIFLNFGKDLAYYASLMILISSFVYLCCLQTTIVQGPPIRLSGWGWSENI